MCAVSMVGDHFNDKWRDRDWYQPLTAPNVFPNHGSMIPVISRAEFDELKREVAEMKELLKRAKAYDAKNGEPNCEIDEKMDLLRKVAKLVGLDIEDVIRAST